MDDVYGRSDYLVIVQNACVFYVEFRKCGYIDEYTRIQLHFTVVVYCARVVAAW